MYNKINILKEKHNYGNKCIWEHNGNDTILYCNDLIGAFTRGENLNIAKSKMPKEIESYIKWLKENNLLSLLPNSFSNIDYNDLEIIIIEEKNSELAICDADSDVIFESEKKPLTYQEYLLLKKLAILSAMSFHSLYNLIPNKYLTILKPRKTFYGNVPINAYEMYKHTKSVNSYYFGEINAFANNRGSIYTCRIKAFDKLEKDPCYLENKVYVGCNNELWSLRKLMRRFIWHDRIHAKAMYKMANKTFPNEIINNIFYFDIK